MGARAAETGRKCGAGRRGCRLVWLSRWALHWWKSTGFSACGEIWLCLECMSRRFALERAVALRGSRGCPFLAPSLSRRRKSSTPQSPAHIAGYRSGAARAAALRRYLSTMFKVAKPSHRRRRHGRRRRRRRRRGLAEDALLRLRLRLAQFLRPIHARRWVRASCRRGRPPAPRASWPTTSLKMD